MAAKYSFQLTPIAEREIDSALSYISELLSNGKAALDLLDKIQHAIETICEFPYSSADCRLFLVTDEKIRHIPVDNYVMIYEINEEIRCVNILRFCFTRMDLSRLTLST